MTPLRRNLMTGTATARLGEPFRRWTHRVLRRLGRRVAALVPVQSTGLPGSFRDAAKAAADSGDWREALRLWDELAQQCPGEAPPLIGKAAALVELDRPAAAEAVLCEAMARFPDHPLPPLHFAIIALRRGDWPELLRRARMLRERFPAMEEGYRGEGEALRQTGRLDEAEAVCAAAAARFPRAGWPLVQYAAIAAGRQDWPEALRRWQAVGSRFPAEPDGYLGAAEAYLGLGQQSAADAVFGQAARRLGGIYSAAQRLAEAAMQGRRWPAAAALWQEIRRNFPDQLAGYLSGAEALQQAGGEREAEDVLELAARRFPDCEAAWLGAVRLALARGDRPASLRRWQSLVRECPAPSPAYRVAREELRKQLALSAPGLDARGLQLEHWVPGTVICEDPVIILSAGEVFEIIEHTAPYYRDRPVYFFVGMLWTISQSSEYRQRFADSFYRLTAQYPNIRITVLANDVAELLCARDLGISAELVNHNAFIDDTAFDILPVEQNFDAVYNARFGGYKRHYLAQRIKRLKLIVTFADRRNLADAKILLPGCTIANQQDGDIVNLSAIEVAHHLNTAKCGLCLSDQEGAMFASAEYLLCGLPVVTTQNAGGRNWFFSTEYTMFCDAEASAVADAVERIGREQISRQLVRESARQRIRRERLVFFALVDRLFAELGQPSRRIEPEFEKRYCDKINYVGRPVADFLVP